MNTQRLLSALGMDEKEMKTYLTCLEFGPISMTHLARRSQQKRPTLYNIIEDLRQKGFVTIVRRNRKTLYDAEKPSKLRSILRAREFELEHLLPELESLRNKHQASPTIEIYEGEEAVKNVYDVLYDGLRKNIETCFLSSVGDLAKHIPYAIDQYIGSVQGKKYPIRELLLDDEFARRFVKQKPPQKIHTQTRLLPVERKIHNDLAIQGDTAYFFTFQHRLIALVIHDMFIVETLKVLFETAWAAGRKV